MHVIHAREKFPARFAKSIFLAGPTPRSSKVASWRPHALAILEKLGYDGVVFVPEDRAGEYKKHYLDQIAWERAALNASDCIVFWVPRKIRTMPAFTTNIEFGMWLYFGKILLGAPKEAPKMGYLKEMAKEYHVPCFDNLEAILKEAASSLGEGALRFGGECQIPLHIWKMRAFQSWYRAHKKVGNRIDGARLEWISRVRSNPKAIFCFALHPNIYVARERRNKLNEPVVFRLDISSILLYRRAADPLDTKIVLVKEFRSPCSNADGFIWELPGGSSPHIEDPLKVAVEEVHEEVGLEISEKRLAYKGSRQLASTLLTHKSHLFSAELTNEELACVEGQKGIPHGADLHNPTGERAYLEVKTVREIISLNLLDWTNVGQVLQALQGISPANS